MKSRPFLRSLAAGAGAALVLVLVLAAWRIWAPAPQPLHAERPQRDVPYVPTLEEVVTVMLDLARVGASDHVVDLGCGDGRILIAAARRGATGYGVDIDPARIREAEANARAAGVSERLRFEVGDLFEAPLGRASVVAIYLLPEINLRLRPRLLAALRPGAHLVSHAFDMGEWRPDRTADVQGAKVHLWIVPARVAGRWTLTDAAGRRSEAVLTQRFQDVAVAAGPLSQPLLSGDRLGFTADLGGGARRHEGRVEGGRIVPVEAGAGWRMERSG